VVAIGDPGGARELQRRDHLCAEVDRVGEEHPLARRARRQERDLALDVHRRREIRRPERGRPRSVGVSRGRDERGGRASSSDGNVGSGGRAEDRGGGRDEASAGGNEGGGSTVRAAGLKPLPTRDPSGRRSRRRWRRRSGWSRRRCAARRRAPRAPARTRRRGWRFERRGAWGCPAWSPSPTGWGRRRRGRCSWWLLPVVRAWSGARV